MDDLKIRIKLLFDEIEFIQLRKLWVERLITLGIDENEAAMWATEIGAGVIDEFRSRLMDLADLLEETDVGRIPLKVHSWAVGVSVVTVPEIKEPMDYLASQLMKYLPSDTDEDDADH